MNSVSIPVLLMVTLTFSINAEQQNTTSRQILADSQKRMQDANFEISENINDVSPWLANAPSLQLSILKSDSIMGADEYEIGFNLPIKSKAHRQLDKALLDASSQFKESISAVQKLLISGLIRESMWNYVVVLKKQEIEQKKHNWLTQQRNNVVELINVGDTTVESLLFVDKRLLDSNLLILELKHQAQVKLAQYKLITGHEVLPEDRVENIVLDFDGLMNKHPKILSFKVALNQSDLIYKGSGGKSNPWNVGITARDVKTSDFTDKQLGVQLQVPLSFKNKKTQTNKTLWIKEQAELSMQLHNFYKALSAEYTALKIEHAFLLDKQKILQQQGVLTNKILSKLRSLRSNNELKLDIYYQRMIELQASQYQAELNQIYIHQNQSRQNQLAGVSL